MEWFKERLILFIVGFSLVLSLFLVRLIQNPYNYESSYSSSNQTELAISEPQPQAVSVIPRPIHKPVANPKPKRDEWRSERDLEAQRDMAQWAENMFYSSIFMAFLSAIGIWLIFATLRETQKATKSAREAVEVTREIGQKQVRAYLHAVDGTINVDPIMVVLSVKVRNIGKSPSIKSSCNGKMWAVYRPPSSTGVNGVRILHQVRKTIEATSISQEFGPVSIGECKSFPFVFIPSDIKDAEIQKLLATEDVDIYFNVSIEWKDVFGVTSKISVKLRKDGDATYTEEYGEKRKTATYKTITISTDI